MESQPRRAEPSTTAYHATKDASHRAFYTGFVKGMQSAIEGIQLFISSKPLQKKFFNVIKPICSAQVLYVSCAILLFLLVKNPADSVVELFWTFVRWSRLVSLITSFILERYLKANTEIFFEALRIKNPAFADALSDKPIVKKTAREHLTKLKRIAKLLAFKMTGSIVGSVFPGGKFIVVPAVKFVSMKPVLGTSVAGAMAAIHLIPAEILESSILDDLLVSFGEAIIDADDMGLDSTRDYSRRLDSVEMRTYFIDRYRGYLTGCGFAYSMLSTVPFLGIPICLIAECGAACVVVNVVERNLEKQRRKSLLCEEAMTNGKSS